MTGTRMFSMLAIENISLREDRLSRPASEPHLQILFVDYENNLQISNGPAFCFESFFSRRSEWDGPIEIHPHTNHPLLSFNFMLEKEIPEFLRDELIEVFSVCRS